MSAQEYVDWLAKKAARAGKKKISHADRVRFGKMGGRGNKKEKSEAEAVPV